jgi:hypothetical protein
MHGEPEMTEDEENVTSFKASAWNGLGKLQKASSRQRPGRDLKCHAEQVLFITASRTALGPTQPPIQ